jgi:hypothetical protein
MQEESSMTIPARIRILFISYNVLKCYRNKAAHHKRPWEGHDATAKSSLKWLKGYKPNEKKTKKQYRQEQADGGRLKGVSELPAARSKKKNEGDQ